MTFWSTVLAIVLGIWLAALIPAACAILIGASLAIILNNFKERPLWISQHTWSHYKDDPAIKP